MCALHDLFVRLMMMTTWQECMRNIGWHIKSVYHPSTHKKRTCVLLSKSYLYCFHGAFSSLKGESRSSNNEQHQQCILTWTDLSWFRQNVSFSMNFKRDVDNTHCTHSSTIKHKHFFPLRGRFEKITDWHRHNNNANVKCKRNNSE